MKSFLLVFLLLTVASLRAQDNTEDLMQMSLDDLLNMKVEVSSSKSVNIFKSPSTVSVIDRQMIRDYNFRSISEAISYLSDVMVGRSYFKQNIPTIRGVLQDHYSNKELLLINGIPLWNAITGYADLDRIGIDEIERIEVLKGPASVLYGTNAYSGAINIVTVKNDADHINLHGSVGELGLLSAGGNLQASSGDLKMFFAFNLSQEDGANRWIPYEGGDTSLTQDYMNVSNFTANLTYKQHNLFVNAYSNNEPSLGTSFNLASGGGSNEKNKGYAVSYGYSDDLFEGFQLKYRLTYDWTERFLIRGYSSLAKGDSIGDEGVGYRVLNELSTYYDITKDLSWEVLADFDYLKCDYSRTFAYHESYIITEANMNDRENNELSIGTQLNYNPIEQAILNLGIRYTNNHLAGDNVSARATAVYELNDKNSIKFIFGQSYRAPTLFEQYFVAPKVVYGNENLKPETSNSFELMYITSFDNFLVQLTGFYAKYDNKIYRGPGTPVPGDTTHYSMYLNGNEFTSKGIELEVKYTNSKILNAFLSYSYDDGDAGDSVAGVYNFLYVPQHQAAFGISKSFGKFSCSASGLLYSQMNAPHTTIDMQYVLNFNLQYQHKMGQFTLRHVLSVKNFMNADTFLPEFTRRKMNDIPWMPPKVISYSVFIDM